MAEPTIRIGDDQLAAPFTVGFLVEHHEFAFTFDFLVRDATGAADYYVARRVLVDPTAMRDLVNIVNLQWNEYQMEYGARD